MSDILIPMAHDPRGHDMQDDCAEWAQENVRPFIAQGCDQQGRHKPTIEPDPVNAVMGMYEDANEQMRSADLMVALFMMKFLGAIAFCLLAAWLWASGILEQFGGWK